uniref:Uncharacterized protein n=1 Tax=Arundo donax TaxID=35708 RepID=A0A0A9B5D9_ARUDO
MPCMLQTPSIPIEGDQQKSYVLGFYLTNHPLIHSFQQQKEEDSRLRTKRNSYLPSMSAHSYISAPRSGARAHL